MKTFLSALLGISLAFGAAAACAQAKKHDEHAAKKEDSARVKSGQGLQNALALCIGCHGIPGYKTAFPEVYHVPKIAGQQPGYLINALKAYKSGERSHPSMRGIAASLSDEDMKLLADYYGGGK